MRRKIMIAMLAGLLIGATGTAAQAAISYSQTSTLAITLGRCYQAQASVNSTGPSATSTVYSKTASGTTCGSATNTPTGYFGARAIVYRDTGYVQCATTQMSYNSAPATQWANSTGSGTCGSGNFTGVGEHAIYNGSSWTTYATKRTGIVTR